MTRYKFVGVWSVDTRRSYCNIECTRWELAGDAILRLYDGDLFIGQFDLGFMDVAYFTEAAG